MTTLAVASVKHSPGATTVALALAAAWAEDGEVLLVEADPAGGDLAVRLGLRSHPGLTSLAAAGRRSSSSLDTRTHSQALASGARVVLAPTAPEEAAAAVAALANRLPRDLASSGGNAVVDCGRWHPTSPARALLERADLAVVALRPTVEGVEHLRSRLDTLAVPAGRLAVALVGERPYGPAEVEAALGLPVLGSVAVDPRGVASLQDVSPARTLRRTPIVRSARTLLDRFQRMDRFVGDASPVRVALP